MSALADVLDALARSGGDDDEMAVQLGNVSLRPHQVDAVNRVAAALDEFGGALLTDEPGMGKTYVALALASRAGRAVVAAPASLRTMWQSAAAQADVPLSFTSLEMLSRGAQLERASLLIVDEAHRASNPVTRRYAALARAARRARVLLLSATPVRNRRAELDALLALFLGPAAGDADTDLIARCTVRRRAGESDAPIPHAVAHPPVAIRGIRSIEAALRALPPPLPLTEGKQAAGLVANGLARCWSSSVAALDRAIVRRLHRCAALEQALSDGRLPTRGELAAWAIGDDAMQFAFPFLAAPAKSDVAGLIATLARHRDGLEIVRQCIVPHIEHDTRRRVAALQHIAARHSDAIVIAFTAFEATATALFASMRVAPGVALITGEGARSGAGPLDRNDVLVALGAGGTRQPASLAVRLLIATDLMAEGVNLQGASVVVHLDDPWTPAAIAQREGRVARIGAPHDTVHFYRFAPSAAVRRLVDMADTHARKDRAAEQARAVGEIASRIRERLRPWRRGTVDPRREFVAATAAVAARRTGVLARVDRGRTSLLVAGLPAGRHRWRVTADPMTVERLLAAVDDPPREDYADPKLVQRAAHAIARWLSHRRARTLSGIGDRTSRVRRCVIEKLDVLVASAPPQLRAALAGRAAQARAELAQMRGAGVEVRLSELLDLGTDTAADAWLTQVEQIVADSRRTPGVPAEDELAALLVLRCGPE